MTNEQNIPAEAGMHVIGNGPPKSLPHGAPLTPAPPDGGVEVAQLPQVGSTPTNHNQEFDQGAGEHAQLGGRKPPAGDGAPGEAAESVEGAGAEAGLGEAAAALLL